MVIVNNITKVIKDVLEELEKDQDLNLKIVDDDLYLVSDYNGSIAFILTETTSKGWEMYEPDETMYVDQL